MDMANQTTSEVTIKVKIVHDKDTPVRSLIDGRRTLEAVFAESNTYNEEVDYDNAVYEDSKTVALIVETKVIL